jgi:hypothetical protein
MLAVPDPAMAITAIAAVSDTYRIALRTMFTLRDGANPKHYILFL